MVQAASVLYDQANELLNAIDTYFTANSPVPPPSRQYVTLGDPAHDFGPENDPDCTGQLTVSIQFVFRGQPGAEDSESFRTRGCVILRSVEYSIELVRCVPTLQDDGTPASADQIDDSALALAIDGWLLSESIIHAWTTGVFCNCQDVQLGRLTAITPRGGVAGWQQTVQLDLSCGPSGS